MGVTPDQYINKLNEHLGYAYGFNDRCGGSYRQHDCSGYMVWAMNQLGLYMPCSTSFVMAQQGYAYGMQIGYEEARRTKAVWCISGPNGGRGPSRRVNGSDGHVACSAGDGTTREARGRAYGVYVGSFDGRGWDAFFKIPGIDYRPALQLAPKPKEYEDMIILAPARQQKNATRPACARLDLASGQVGMINGAKVHQIKAGRTYTVPVPAGSKVIGWYETFNPNGSKKGFKVIGSHDPSGWPAYECTWV